MAPYELWNTRRSLGVMREVEPVFDYWLTLGFQNQINSTDEYIDFEKLPNVTRKLAPFVRPLGSGKPIYNDSGRAFRFKPAYSKVKEVIDPLMPLVRRPGIDATLLGEVTMTPMQRREAIRAAMTVQAVNAIKRRQEWMAAKAIIDGRYTVSGEEYPAVLLDFLRAANHTVVKTSGNYWGQSGVSIFDDIQTYADRMFNAEFGAFPTRLTITPKVWKVMRNSPEFMEHMDKQIRGEAATITRGLISADKVTKVGELLIGGASGASIEIWLYRDTYVDDVTGAQVPFLADGDIVLTGTANAIQGYRCFGAIIDPYAQYQALEIFPRNWMETGDPAVEYFLWQSAPLMVPVNPNATLKATVVG